MNINKYSTLDKQLEFYVKANPRNFLFIKVSGIDSYRYVMVKLKEFVKLSETEFCEENNILKDIKMLLVKSY